jgi:KaiC/GvpD/RAD55 family RecA-like ATPase
MNENVFDFKSSKGLFRSDDSIENNYKIFNTTDFLKIQGSERKMYLDPIVRRESIILITGPSGSGKTMFTMGLCKSIVSGQSFGNWTVKNKSKVLYVDGELPVYLMKERIQLLNLQEADFYLLSSSVNNKNYNLSDTSLQEFIFHGLKERSIDVCVFDNLSSLTTGLDENSKRDYDPVNRFFLHLRQNGITSIIVHHTNKRKNEQRGTSGRTDNIDIWCNIQSTTHNDQLKIKLDFKKWRFEQTELIRNPSFIFGDNEWVTSNDNSEKISEQYITILKFIKDGMNQTQISKELNCTQPNINKICKILRELGLLEGKNIITEQGMIYVTDNANIS